VVDNSKIDYDFGIFVDIPHKRLGRVVNLSKFESLLPPDNVKQREAIMKALSARFTLIHGPPGYKTFSKGNNPK
jgi:hypothetical protein